MFTQKLFWSVLGLTIISLIVMVISEIGGWNRWAAVDFATGFYGPAGRGWEFGLGCLAALPQFRRLNTMMKPMVKGQLANLGLVGVGLSVFLIPPDLAFPSPTLAIPVLGAFLLVAFGDTPAGPATRLLSGRILNWLGEYSYSIYLWHWPLIVFASLLFPGSVEMKFLFALASLGLAVVSYHLVERPNRSLSFTPLSFAKWSVPVGALSVISLLFSLLYWAPRVAEGSIEPRALGEIEQQTSFSDMVLAYGQSCDQSKVAAVAELSQRLNQCFASDLDTPTHTAVIGDSHSWMVFPGLVASSKIGGVLLAPVSDPSVIGAELQQIASHLVELDGLESVFISAYWEHWGVPQDELKEVLDTLERNEVEVFILSGIPDFPFGAQNCKYQLNFLGTVCTIPVRTHTEGSSAYIADLATAVQTRTAADVLGASGYFCNTMECSMVKGTDLYFFDGNHLNSRGAKYLFANLLLDDSRVARVLGE